MIKTFYCFRHGQTDWNKRFKIQGCEVNLPLNETGEKQAKSIPNFDIDVIYYSPMVRAEQTAKIYNKKKHLKTISEHGIKEIHFGDWSGMTWEEVESKYGIDMVEKFQSADEKDDNFQIPNGDVKIEAVNRFIKALKKIAKNSNKEKIGVFTHGRLLYFISNKLSPSGKYYQLMNNSEHFEFEYDTETDELVLVEDNK